MKRTWTPKITPPHPTKISKVSALGQRIIDILTNQAMEKKQLLYRKYCHGDVAERSVFDVYSNNPAEIEYLMCTPLQSHLQNNGYGTTSQDKSISMCVNVLQDNTYPSHKLTVADTQLASANRFGYDTDDSENAMDFPTSLFIKGDAINTEHYRPMVMNQDVEYFFVSSSDSSIPAKVNPANPRRSAQVQNYKINPRPNYETVRYPVQTTMHNYYETATNKGHKAKGEYDKPMRPTAGVIYPDTQPSQENWSPSFNEDEISHILGGLEKDTTVTVDRIPETPDTTPDIDTVILTQDEHIFKVPSACTSNTDQIRSVNKTTKTCNTVQELENGQRMAEIRKKDDMALIQEPLQSIAVTEKIVREGKKDQDNPQNVQPEVRKNKEINRSPILQLKQHKHSRVTTTVKEDSEQAFKNDPGRTVKKGDSKQATRIYQTKKSEGTRNMKNTDEIIQKRDRISRNEQILVEPGRKDKVKFGAGKTRAKFVVPLKKTEAEVSRSLCDNSLQVVHLNTYSIKDMQDQLEHSPPQEVCLSLVYQDGHSQLSSSDSTKGVDAIMFRIAWSPENIEYCFIHISSLKSSLKVFFGTLMSTVKDIACYGGQELIVYMSGMLGLTARHVSDWCIHDTRVAQWLLSSDCPTSHFDELVKVVFGDEVEDDTRPSGASTQKTCKLLDLLSKVTKTLSQQLREKNMWTLFKEMEVRLTPILASMELKGILVNRATLQDMGQVIQKRLETLEQEAYDQAGKRFQLSSPAQLRRVLYDHLQLDVKFKVAITGTTTLGAKSTSETMLRTLEPHHPLPSVVLEHRHLHKIKSTYVDGILNSAQGDVVHSIWEQTSAATGRLASSNPNLQAVPRNTVLVKSSLGNKVLNLRKAFIAHDGYSFISADFKHIELRLFAHLSKDPVLREVFQRSGDIFTTLAELWLKKEPDSVTQEDRDKTKKIVYALMYGAGPAKLAQLLLVPKNEATQIVQDFTGRFPRLKKFTREVIARCRSDGYLMTMQGRTRQFPRITDTNYVVRSQTERQALNFVIQGAAADLCKLAIITTQHELNKRPELDVTLVLQIHDELVWEARDDHVDAVTDIIKHVMEDETCSKLDVPILIKTATGKSWGSM